MSRSWRRLTNFWRLNYTVGWRWLSRKSGGASENNGAA